MDQFITNDELYVYSTNPEQLVKAINIAIVYLSEKDKLELAKMRLNFKNKRSQFMDWLFSVDVEYKYNWVKPARRIYYLINLYAERVGAAAFNEFEISLAAILTLNSAKYKNIMDKDLEFMQHLDKLKNNLVKEIEAPETDENGNIIYY